jgi:hypothetical protein
MLIERPSSERAGRPTLDDTSRDWFEHDPELAISELAEDEISDGWRNVLKRAALLDELEAMFHQPAYGTIRLWPRAALQKFLAFHRRRVR